MPLPWLPWTSRKPAARSSAPFTVLRRRLVAWNIGVLCAILLVVAGSVYVSQTRAVTGQVDAQLRSQAQRGLTTGRADEEIAEAQAATHSAGAEDESSEPYEASDSPNVFSLMIDANGHVVRKDADLQALSLPDMAAAWPILRGTQSSSLVTVERRTSSGDVGLRLYTVPIKQSGRIVGALQVGTSLTPRYAELRAFLLWLGGAGAMGVVLAAVGGLFLAERALVPIQAAYERQRVFVGDASHELRTPLSLMRAEAELLLHAAQRSRGRLVAEREAVHVGAAGRSQAPVAEALPDSDPEEQAEMARDLVAEVDYMSHLVDHLLQLARMDSDAESLQLERIALSELAERTCRFAEPMAAERGLRLTFEAGRPSTRLESAGASTEALLQATADGAADAADADGADGAAPAPALDVWGDPERLRQLLLILLDNALRYTPAPGAIRVACWQQSQAGARAGEEAVVVEVADSGPGIAPEHLPHLFDRFYRVDKARSRELGGSGLGLAIAQGIARAHRGSLGVESEPGVGTRFQLILPAADPD